MNSNVVIATMSDEVDNYNYVGDYGIRPVDPDPSSMPPRTHGNFNNDRCKGLGIIMIITGGLCIPLQIAALVLVTSSPLVTGWGNLSGVGIWTGLVFLMTGCAAASASESPNATKLHILVIMSVISMIMVVPMVIFMAISLDEANNTRSARCRFHGGCWLDSTPVCFSESTCDDLTSVLVLSSFLLVFSLLNGLCGVFLYHLSAGKKPSVEDHAPSSTDTTINPSPGGAGELPVYQAPTYHINNFNTQVLCNASAPPFPTPQSKPDSHEYDNSAYQGINLGGSSDSPPPYNSHFYNSQAPS